MTPVSRRSFLKLGAGLVAFIPAARALAAVPGRARSATTGQPAPRVEKYVGGWVTGVQAGQIKLRSYDGDYVLQLSDSSQIWKGAWDRSASVEAGDRIDAWGTRQAGGRFDVERMWVNIVNLFGPVSNPRQATDGLHFTLRDRFRGSLSVLVDEHTTVVSAAGEHSYVPGQLHFTAGQSPQIIGLLLKDGSVRATRVFS